MSANSTCNTRDTSISAASSVLVGRLRSGRGGRRPVFAVLPSMRNLAPEVVPSRGGKQEGSRRRYPDSEEPQTAGHQSSVRGRRVSGHPDRRNRAEARRGLYRHAQRAGRLLRGASPRLKGPPGAARGLALAAAVFPTKVRSHRPILEYVVDDREDGSGDGQWPY
jgi:hypothetical protein